MLLKTNNRKVISLFLILLLFLSLFHYDQGSISGAKTRLKTTKSKLYIYKGKTVKLKLKNYSFRSSKSRIAFISKKGKIKAKKAGKAKITAISFDGKKKVIYTVKVGNHIKSLSIDNATTIVLSIGSQSTLRTTISPSGVLYKKLTYTSDAPGIASVDKNGVVTGISKGIAVVSVASKAVTKKNKKLTQTVTIVVQGSVSTPSPDEPGDLINDLGDFTIVIPTSEPVNTPVPTEEPRETTSPTDVPYVTAAPTEEPHETSAPTDNPQPTSTPTTEPQPTVDPTFTPAPTATPAPLTVEEYIASLVPDDNEPVVGKFLLSSGSRLRTVYLINKNYSGRIRLEVNGYVHSSDVDALSLLKRLQDETGSVTNSAGTVTASKLAKRGKWTIEFLQTGEKYYIQASVTDNAYNTAYGIIAADGDTLNSVKIISEK